MSQYNHEYCTGTNRDGSPWTNRCFWDREESARIWSIPSMSDKPWLFWRVGHDTKGPYLSLRYRNDDRSEEGKELRKSIYSKLKQIINCRPVFAMLELLNRCYPDCVHYPNHGNYFENTLVHIRLRPILEIWPDDRGSYLINVMVELDNVLRKRLSKVDWNAFE